MSAQNQVLDSTDGAEIFRIDVSRWMRNRQSHILRHEVCEPKEIAWFSIGKDKIVRYGSREQLKRYREPRRDVHLWDKIDSFLMKENDKPLVEVIVKALEKQGIQLYNETEVVTYRNNLNKIGKTVFDTGSNWEFECILHNGTLLLDIVPTEIVPRSGMHHRLMYYGYRFESVCTGMEDESVDCNEEFCSVLRLNIGRMRVVMSAEIDCTSGNPENTREPVRQYVELKTMRPLRGYRDRQNMYRYRYPRYWLQSYLAGVRRIIVGSRTDEGKLLDVRSVETQAMFSEAVEFFRGDERKVWNPTTVINFIFHVLETLRSICQQHEKHTIRVRYEPQRRCIVGSIVATGGAGLDKRLRDVQKGRTT